MSAAKLSIPILLLLGTIAVLALGCGIGSDPAHHEPLAAMRITGSRVAGQEMRLELDYRQTYPVDVDVECDLKQAGTVVQVIGAGAVPANPGATPKSTPAVGMLAYPFTVDRAGSYSVVCFTTADAENKFTQFFSVSAP